MRIIVASFEVLPHIAVIKKGEKFKDMVRKYGIIMRLRHHKLIQEIKPSIPVYFEIICVRYDIGSVSSAKSKPTILECRVVRESKTGMY